jgi:hypothetical protein
VIENERQYRITKAWVDTFARSAREMAEPGAVADPLIQAAMVAQYESQIEEMQHDLAEFEVHTVLDGRD